ncbi:MAG: DUF4332 domain-containing protein [Anaerolineales bacterium]
MRRMLGKETVCSLSRRQCWAAASGTLLLVPLALILRGMREARRMRRCRRADRARATIDLTHWLHEAPNDDAPPQSPDDLTRIKGIGPKMAAILRQAGILTYADLARAELTRLEEILASERLLSLAKPATWQDQARLASQAAWEDLQALQQRL